MSQTKTQKPEPTWEEIASEIFGKSWSVRKRIERLPIRFRDAAIHMAIAPFLSGGKGVTPRKIVVLQEEVLRELVKKYFKRQGYESYTDKELWIRKRRYEGGYGKEEYPIPDVFARKKLRLAIVEVKDNVSAKSIRDCILTLTECQNFANRVYAAFPYLSAHSKRRMGDFLGKLRRLKDAVPEAGLLLVDHRRATVREVWKTGDHRPKDQRKWNEYYYHFDRARARSVRKRSISLRLTKKQEEKLEREYPGLSREQLRDVHFLLRAGEGD